MGALDSGRKVVKMEEALSFPSQIHKQLCCDKFPGMAGEAEQGANPNTSVWVEEGPPLPSRYSVLLLDL